MGKELMEAKKVLEAFLVEHPDLAEAQAEIDRILSKVAPEKRMDVILLLMAGKLQELQNGLKSLLLKGGHHAS